MINAHRRVLRLAPMFFALCVLALPVLMGALGCSSAQSVELPDRRPVDFTLGVVVFGTSESDPPANRPARYIIDASGVLRASVGSGSSALTHPLYTRRLDSDQIDEIWEMVRRIGFDDDPTATGGIVVRSPEGYSPGSGNAYLVEIRSMGVQGAWAFEPTPGPTMDLVNRLAELAWIND